MQVFYILFLLFQFFYNNINIVTYKYTCQSNYKKMNYKENVCECPKLFEVIPSSLDLEDSGREAIDLNIQLLDFGKVEIGRKKCLKITLSNKENSENVFTVSQDVKSNPLYQVFEIGSYKYKTSPLNQVNAKIYYKPLFPSTSFEHFTIIDSFDTVIKVTIKGTGVGPELQASTNFLKFQTWPGRKSCRQILELKNSSAYEAVFSFDCDMENSIFKVDPLFGTIPGRKYVYVNVTFKANEYGHYAFDLTCLINCQDPIIIKLFGVYSQKTTLKDAELIQNSENITSNNYVKYMQDIQEKTNEEPMFSLTEHVLDFMGVNITPNNNENCKTLVTSMTNHSKNKIFVNWGEGDNFKIVPQKVYIPKNESALFECKFCPDKPDLLYSKTLIGNVFWNEDNDLLEVPKNVTLRLLGHSFHGDTFWLPQLDIPEAVILPPSIPGESSYQTFPLTSRGHLPVSFHFIPPKNSNFLVKPLVGLVKGLKLICVQLSSKAEKETKVYIEQWKVQLNGQITHCRCFYIKCSSEDINVLIGKDNRIKIGCVQNGCYEKVLVPIKNMSLHPIHYELPFDEEYQLHVKDPNGDLEPNETKNLELLFTGFTLGSMKYIFIYRIYLLKQHVIIGKPIEKELEVYTESSYSELCCMPNFYDFGSIQCHTQELINFQIYNFGESVLHYRLFCLNNNGNVENDVKINPDVGTLKPRTTIKTFVKYKACIEGKRIMNIFYKIRRNQVSLEVLPDYQKKIFTMKADCIHPYLQITDILYHNYGPNFTKVNLWNLLNIEEVNKVLRSVKNDQHKCVELRVPDHEKIEKEFQILLLLKNKTKFQIEVYLKPKKECDCEKIELNTSMSFRKYDYSCPHKQICMLHLTDMAIPGDSIEVLEMNISYTIPGINYVSYCFRLCRFRCIEMIYRVNVLTSLVKTISMYKLHNLIKCDPVCLSEFEPMAECVWLYNNSSNVVKYKLETNSLKEFNFALSFEAFEFRFCDGVIEPFSTSCIMLKYTPIEEKIFQLNLPLHLGEELTLIRFNVEGTKDFNQFIQKPKMFSVNVSNKPLIIFSEDHLQIKPFPVLSSTTRMIFIRNVHQDIIGYSWQRSTIKGLVDVFVDNQKGVLLPGESHAVIIKIQSFAMPCKILINFSCKLLNHSQYYLHKQTLAAHNARQYQITQEFEINEYGYTEPPVNNLKIVSFPNYFYTSISLEIHITSTTDRDLHYKPETQFTQTPQNLIPFKNEDYSHKAIVSVVNPLDKPIKALKTEADKHDEQVPELRNEENKGCGDSVETKKENIKFFKDVMECLIADAIFSPLFRSVLNLQYHTPPLHYTQITKSEEDKPSRCELINDLYNDPPPPAVGEVLKEIITESIHEIFKLGAPKTKRSRFDYIEDIQRHINKINCGKDCTC